MSTQQRGVQADIHHLNCFFEVVVVLDVSSCPSSSSDNDGLVGGVEALEHVDDFLVVFDGVEVLVHEEVDGCVLVLSVVDVGDGVGALEDVGHLFAELATSADEQDFFHLCCYFWILVWFCYEL